MAIYYRAIILNATAPAVPTIGTIWIAPVDNAYQPYIWLNKWAPMLGGGITKDETNTDTHYVNVVVQEARPDGIVKPGWIWIKQSTNEAKLAMLSDKGAPYRDQDYVLIAAA